MNYVGRKVYYDSITGAVIVDTGEKMGEVLETTQAEDITTYPILETVTDLDVLNLPYGYKAEEFKICKSMRVDPNSQALIIEQYTPEELALLQTP